MNKRDTEYPHLLACLRRQGCEDQLDTVCRYLQLECPAETLREMWEEDHGEAPAIGFFRDIKNADRKDVEFRARRKIW